MSRDPTVQAATVDLGPLIDWYEAQVDGAWEHRHGLKLESLDNPGWLLTVDLMHTDLNGQTMADLSEGCSPDGHPVAPNWIHCRIADGRFLGACDPRQLPRLLRVFIDLSGESG
ncbi:immunity 53 family protein [Luteolibacter marinus]|uniref:immunity 53 family protein n=1 Tax=Luteolibacter marinus TaxID=2776705 RepID=UPI00186629DF|nr:immunity 53 family protein [Luteolibacter marinus]